MAYKFSIGTAKLSGSVQVAGTVDVTGEITGSTTISASSNITLAGANATSHTLRLDTEAVVSASGLIMSGGSNVPLAEVGLDGSNNGMINLFEGANTVITVGVSPEGSGSITLHSGSGDEHVSMTNGALSASATVRIAGNLDIGGNATINGNLVDQVAGVRETVTLPTFETTDESLTLDHSDGAGLEFGTNAAGGSLLVANSIQQYSSSVNMSASAWYGNGGQLTDVSAGGLRLSINSISSLPATAVTGLNRYSAGTNGTLSLPTVTGAGSEVSAGSQVTIKNNGSAEVTLQRHADDAGTITIDGETSVILFGGASVTCILSASDDNSAGEWFIF